MDGAPVDMVMVNGIGANLTNEEKKAHLIDFRHERLIDKVCIQELLHPRSRVRCYRASVMTLPPSGRSRCINQIRRISRLARV
jgi:hypothetical protein